jgi:hypothetical protein
MSNYKLIKPLSTIGNPMSGQHTLEIMSGMNEFCKLGDGYLAVKVTVTGPNNESFGSFSHPTNKNSDTIIYPSDNFVNCFFQSTRVRYMGNQLPTINDYSIASTLYKILMRDRAENSLFNGDQISLIENSSIPEDTESNNRITSALTDEYVYNGINKQAHEKVKSLLSQSVTGGNVTSAKNVRTFWVAGKLDCQLFNKDTIMGPNSKVCIDLLVDNNFHYNLVQYSRKNGSVSDIPSPATNLNILKGETAVANSFSITASDISLYVPCFTDNAIISSTLKLKTNNLFVHRRNLNTNITSDSFNVNFPSPPELVCVAFQDSRVFSQGYSPSYFGLQKDKSVLSADVDEFITNSAQLQVQSVELLFANQTYPKVRYNIRNQLDATSLEEIYRAYLDTVFNSGMASRKSGLLSFNAFRNNPIFCYQVENDETTSAVINLQFNEKISQNNTVVVWCMYNENISINYNAEGMVDSTTVTR